MPTHVKHLLPEGSTCIVKTSTTFLASSQSQAVTARAALRICRDHLEGITPDFSLHQVLTRQQCSGKHRGACLSFYVVLSLKLSTGVGHTKTELSQEAQLSPSVIHSHITEVFNLHNQRTSN